MPIVGTAGHVDHGKSTLVRVLTGTDPDRWAEEKERGLTIDLGFAWADFDGIDVGFVDVPGHERFIKNMLAGVGAVDCALFVVAADSGWMPQSEEHAAVLDLIGVLHGVIALSRIDLVDDDTLELATLEVLSEIEGTALESWPIVPVSAVTGAGVPELRTAIAGALGDTAVAEMPFRMWIDRSFSIAGAGQVVTGSVISGSAGRDDVLDLLPSGASVRVRSVQHHGGVVDSVSAGDRAALNLAGTPDAIARGDLLAAPGTATTTNRILAVLRPARAFESVPDRGAFHIHIGTASRPAHARRLGDSEVFVLSFRESVPVSVGDPIILRDSGRKAVVGGGVIVDPHPTQRPTVDDAQAIRAVLDTGPDGQADALLAVHGSMPVSLLASSTRCGKPTNALIAGDLAISPAQASDHRRRALALVAEHHADHPTRPGVPKAELASRLGIDVPIIDAIVASTEDLEERAGAIRVAGFTNELAESEEHQWRIVRDDLEKSFDVPRLKDLPLDEETLHYLIRSGDLVRVDPDLAFTKGQAEDLMSRVGELPDGFTVSEFRTHFGMTRRQAVPVVEWLDSLGRTRRNGDGREVRGRT